MSFSKLASWLGTEQETSKYLKAVFVLVSGTAIAQAIPFLLSPLLLRLYTPKDFGFYGVFVSWVSVLSSFMSAKYELAIVLPESDDDGMNLLVLTLKIGFISSLVLLLVFGVGIFFYRLFCDGNKNYDWFWMVVVGALFVVCYNAFQLWFNRLAQFKYMSLNRVYQGLAFALLSVVFGLFCVSKGQVFSFVFSYLFASFLAFLGIGDKNRFYGTILGKFRMDLAKKYIRHAINVAPSQLIGVFAMQVPIFAINMFYSADVIGCFVLASRIVAFPVPLIAGALGDIYRQKAVECHKSLGSFANVYKKTVIHALFIGSIPFLMFFFFSDAIFVVLFGEAWRLAGKMAGILSVASFFQFMFTPIDKGAIIVGAYAYIFWWHVLRFALMVLSSAIIGFLGFNVFVYLWIYVMINVVFYIFEGTFGYLFARYGHWGHE